MFATSFLIPLFSAAAVIAQNIVTVLPDDPRLIISQDGQRLSASYLASPDLQNAGLYDQCEGMLALNATIDNTCTLIWTGTQVDMDFITCDLCTEAGIYIDGVFQEYRATYSDNDASPTCYVVSTFTTNPLELGQHNITIVNSDPTGLVIISDFQYVPGSGGAGFSSSMSGPLSVISTAAGAPTPTPTPSAVGPLTTIAAAGTAAQPATTVTVHSGGLKQSNLSGWVGAFALVSLTMYMMC